MTKNKYMKVILLQDVPKIGKKYETKEVNSGHAINLLIPKKLAIIATPDNVKKMDKVKKEVSLQKDTEDKNLKEALKKLSEVTVSIKEKTNEKGSLFHGVSAKDLSDNLKKNHQMSISDEFIILDKPIKEVGEFVIPVSINNQKSSFKVVVEKI